jgi:hypothetical protein
LAISPGRAELSPLNHDANVTRTPKLDFGLRGSSTCATRDEVVVQSATMPPVSRNAGGAPPPWCRTRFPNMTRMSHTPRTRVAHCTLLASTPTHLVVTTRPVLGTPVGDAPLYARCWDLLHRTNMRACDLRHAHACSRPGRHTGETVSLVRVQRCSCFLQRSRDRGEPHFVTSGYASPGGLGWLGHPQLSLAPVLLSRGSASELGERLLDVRVVRRLFAVESVD